MQINRYKNPELKERVYYNIVEFERGLIAYLYSNDLYRNLRTDRFLKLYFSSNVKRAIDSGSKKYLDGYYSEVIDSVLSEANIKLTSLNGPKGRRINCSTMLKATNAITAHAYTKQISSAQALEANRNIIRPTPTRGVRIPSTTKSNDTVTRSTKVALVGTLGKQKPKREGRRKKKFIGTVEN